MNDLVTFLRARLDEDEAAAVAAGDAAAMWQAEPPGMFEGRVNDSTGEVVMYDEGSPTLAQAQHIARQDPARVLREVEAGRAILAEYMAVRKLQERTGTEKDGYRDWILRHLAAVYRDHPDYDEEWKP